jgi:hypothetical protein
MGELRAILDLVGGEGRRATFARVAPALVRAAGLATAEWDDGRWVTVVVRAGHPYRVNLTADAAFVVSRFAFPVGHPAVAALRQAIREHPHARFGCKVPRVGRTESIGYTLSQRIEAWTPGELTAAVADLGDLAARLDEFLARHA